MNVAVPRPTNLPSQRWTNSLKFNFIYYRNIWKYIVGLSLKLQNVQYRVLIRFWRRSVSRECTEYMEQSFSRQANSQSHPKGCIKIKERQLVA